MYHKIVKYEGHLTTRLLIKMDSRGNMKTKSNIKYQNKILKCKESKWKQLQTLRAKGLKINEL